MTDFAPSVLLIYTGGTIGMIENPETGALESFNFDHLLNFVPELKRFNYHINTYSFDNGRFSFSAISRYLKPETCMANGTLYSLGNELTTRCISFRS